MILRIRDSWYFDRKTVIEGRFVVRWIFSRMQRSFLAILFEHWNYWFLIIIRRWFTGCFSNGNEPFPDFPRQLRAAAACYMFHFQPVILVEYEWIRIFQRPRLFVKKLASQCVTSRKGRLENWFTTCNAANDKRHSWKTARAVAISSQISAISFLKRTYFTQ